MGELLDKIKAHREAILLGEIGALLHMLGKCSSEFLKANSKEGGAQDRHTELGWMSGELKSCLEIPKLTDAFVFPFDGQPEKLTGNFTDFITKYKGSSPDSVLLHLFNTCHRMTSADEKGVVRRQQSKDHKDHKDHMVITTPFGYAAQELDLNAVNGIREEMDRCLSKTLAAYLEKLDIDGLHGQAVRVLQKGMSRTLGETRQPANDVTLWSQSHGVASLYKPVLATLALGLDPCPRKDNDRDYNNVRWRLFGIGWNGLAFVQRGRRPGDILRRQEILQDISEQLQRSIEVQYPLGNLFYQDLNGLFFTFPGLEGQDGQAEALVTEAALEIVGIVRGRSDMELWPFFTLSKPRRTLTTITREIEARDRLAALPRVAALLSLERDRDQREEKLIVDGPALSPPATGQDICPVCQFRSKPPGKDACQVCQDRRSGRQDAWKNDRQGQTIWIDEIADRNNRLALLTLRFDLSRWLNGEWLTTVWSQTYDDWLNSVRMQQILNNQQQRRKVEAIRTPIAAVAEFAAAILTGVGTNQVTQDAGFKASALSTFFEDVEASQNRGDANYIVPFLENLRGRINDSPGYQLTGEDLATAVFTQNPSPARLRRIWEATESFLGDLIKATGSETFAARPQRLRFTVATSLPWAQDRQTCGITVPGLKPATLTVLCLDAGQHPGFSTVASLEHFRLADGGQELHGPSAVRSAIEKGGISEWRDEETGQRIASARNVPCRHIQGFDSEGYLPFIVLGRSPAFCQLLLPADSTPDVLHNLLALADQHFGKVQGKLPLHASLLVVNRRFPLYALLEAGQMALDHESCGKGALQSPWWDDVKTHGQDSFYGHYPTTKPSGDRGWALTDLAPVNQANQFWMTPGYFDFDLLSSTADRHCLTYEAKDGDGPVRLSIAYGSLHPRPIPLHRLRDLVRIWEILAGSLGPTQRHHLEEALTSKLEEWEAMDRDEVRPVFETFGKALLQRTFGKEWDALSQERRSLLEQSLGDGLLLEALELFQHVVKKEAPDG